MIPTSCRHCGADLGPLEGAEEAGALARRFATAISCDRCASDDDVRQRSEQVRLRIERSDVPLTLASPRFEDLVGEQKQLAIEAARQWADGQVSLLALYGDGEHLPDRLAATAAVARLQREAVCWVSAGDIEELKAIDKRARSALVITDAEQAGLLRSAQAELFEIVSWRQRRQLPLLVTANMFPSKLKEIYGEPFVRLLRRGKSITIVDEGGGR